MSSAYQCASMSVIFNHFFKDIHLFAAVKFLALSLNAKIVKIKRRRNFQVYSSHIRLERDPYLISTLFPFPPSFPYLLSDILGSSIRGQFGFLFFRWISVGYVRGCSRSLWCFGGESEALVLGVEFCACASESAPFFPADFSDFGVFHRHMIWVFGLVLDLIRKGEAFILGVDFCTCASGSAQFFSRGLLVSGCFSSYGMGVWTRSGCYR